MTDQEKPGELTFQPRPADSVCLGLRPKAAPGPVQGFAAREAATTVLAPPHWEGLQDSPAPAETAPPAAPGGPRKARRPAPHAPKEES